MELLAHLGIFTVAAACIFLFGGLLVTTTDQVARLLHRSGFAVAFIILGTLTSLSEISVAINATLEHVPQVSTGNLLGASFVIFLLIIPFLAFFGRGLTLKKTLPPKNLLLALVIIAAPAAFVLDGQLTRLDGAIMLGLYVVLLIYTGITTPAEPIPAGTTPRTTSKLWFDFLKILVGSAAIFFSSKLLVQETIYFSTQLAIPASLIGLLLLGIGTNMPELVIAIRSIRAKKKIIAFGDYVGSAAFNTAILGVVAVANGPFTLERREFLVVAVFLVAGLAFFYIFARSKNAISRTEGALLGLVYLVFLLANLVGIASLR